MKVYILKKIDNFINKIINYIRFLSRMDSEIQDETIIQIINFTGYSDIVYIAIGSANDADQQFSPIIRNLAQKFKLMIKIVLIDPNIENMPVCIKKFDIMANKYYQSDIFVFVSKSTIYYHDFSYGFNSSNSDKLIYSLLRQLKRKKRVHPHKTNLLFIQDFTKRNLKKLENHIIMNNKFNNILNNIIISDVTSFYIIKSRVEVFLPETVTDDELIFYFASANNDRILHYYMLDQVQKRISITHQYFIPQWQQMFTYLSKLNDTKPPNKNFFMQHFPIDKRSINNDFYRRQLMKSITLFLVIKIRQRLKFLSILGFLDTTMHNFYELCKLVVTNPHLSREMRNMMIVCCNNIVRKLQRTNFFIMQNNKFPYFIKQYIWMELSHFQIE